MSSAAFHASVRQQTADLPELNLLLSSDGALRIVLRLMGSGWTLAGVEAVLVARSDATRDPRWVLFEVLRRYSHLPPAEFSAWLDAFHGDAQTLSMQSVEDAIMSWRAAVPGNPGPLCAAAGLTLLDASAMHATGVLNEGSIAAFTANPSGADG